MPIDNEDKAKFHYAGFCEPTTTPVPDDVFDLIAPELTEAELRVLLYILRRTFGFKKRSDSISLSQMVNGITKKNGEILDRGTGMSRRGVMKGCAGLASKGIITVLKNRSAFGDNEVNIYTLRFRDQSMVGNEIPYRRERSTPPVGNEVPPQETVIQQTEEQETGHSNLRMAPIFSENSQKPSGNAQSSNIDNPYSQDKEDFSEENDEDREIIRAYIQDFGRELGDVSKLRSSVSRAYNLYRKSGVSREAFITRMYEAKSITQDRTANIRNLRQEDGKTLPKKSKMAYWFATLSNLLEGKVPQRRQRRREGPEPVTP